MNGQFYRNKLSTIKFELHHGIITYDEAKLKAQPVIDEMNSKASEIYKKYGKKFKKFTFSYLMR